MNANDAVSATLSWAVRHFVRGEFKVQTTRAATTGAFMNVFESTKKRLSKRRLRKKTNTDKVEKRHKNKVFIAVYLQSTNNSHRHYLTKKPIYPASGD